MKLKYFFVVCYSILALTINSCATDEDGKPKTEAEKMYRIAVEQIDDGRYLPAIELLNSIRTQHPYSYYATHAELKLADIYFLQENYEEAAAAYLLFKELHPKHKKASYVLYRISESYYMQKPDTNDRDLEPCYGAIKYYAELLRVYPKSPYTKDAIKNINSCKEQIEDKEVYIADFYFKTKEYNSARYRYIDIVSNNTRKELVDHAIKRIILSSTHLEQKDQCDFYYKQLISRVSPEEKESVNNIYRKCK